MELKKYAKSLLIFVLAIIGVIGLNFNVIQGTPFLGMFFGKTGQSTLYGVGNVLNGNYSGLTIAGIFEFFALYFFIKNNTQIDNKRLKIISLILAVFLSLFVICGNAIMVYYSLSIIFDYFIIYTIKFVGMLIVLYNLILIIFDKMLKFEKINIDDSKFFTGNLRSFFIVLFILLLAWTPYYLEHFPGVLTYDSTVEIRQVLGESKLTNTNPIVHIAFLFVSIWIGKIWGTITAGVAINIILQFLIVASVCSFTIYYLAKKKVDVRIRISILLFFAFFPLVPFMSLIIQKDTLFSALMLLCMIVFYEILTNYKILFNKKLRLVFAFLIIVVTALSRRNALYVIVLSAIFMSLYIFIKRKVYKGYVIKSLVLLMGSVIFAFSINKFVAYQIRNPDSWKNYVPAQYNVALQQLLRATIDHENELDEKDLKLMQKFYSKNDDTSFRESYTLFLTDTAMYNADSVFFKEHKDEIMKLYYKLMFKYPLSYIDAIFCTTSTYWDIEESRYSLWLIMQPNDLGVKPEPIKEIYLAKFVENMMNYQNIPLVGLLFNSAFPFWILLGLIFFNLYNKKYDLLILMIPVVLYYATFFIGPLNGELRYMFYLHMIVPLLIALTFHSMNTKE